MLEKIRGRQIFQAALALLIVLSIPPVFLGLTIILAVRYAILTIARKLRPDLENFVTGVSALFTIWPAFNLVFCIFIDGDIPLQRCQNLFKKNILSKKDSDGKLLYRKLKQIWTSFMGFTFWKEDEDFRLENHVREYDYEGNLKLAPGCTEEEVQGIVSGLIEKPWKKGRSPWEALVFSMSEENEGENSKTLYVLRYHHALFDGFSFAKLMKNLAQTDFKLALPKTFRRSRAIKMEEILRIPYDLSGIIIDNWDFQEDWHFPAREDHTRDYHISAYVSLPVESIKAVKEKLGVAYAVVLFSVVGGSIQEMFKQAQLPVPDFLTTFIPIPRPKHPEGLNNHMSFCPFKWPINAESTVERAKKIQEIFKKMSKSLAIGVLFFIPEMIALLPNFAQSIFGDLTVTGGSVIASCFPVPPEQCYYDGKVARSLYVELGMPGKTVGTSIIMAGINGRQGIALTMDKRIFPSKKIFQRFGEIFEQELKSLLTISLHPPGKSNKVD